MEIIIRAISYTNRTALKSVVLRSFFFYLDIDDIIYELNNYLDIDGW